MQLVMMEGHPKTRDFALDISFYAVFEPNVLALISVFFILRWLLDFFKQKLIRRVIFLEFSSTTHDKYSGSRC